MKKTDEKPASPSTPAAKSVDNNPKDSSPSKEPAIETVPSKESAAGTDDLRRRVRDLEEERERLRRQNQELQDKHLRARADYDNLVKRSQKDVQDTVRFVKSGLLLRLAAFVETFESLAHDLEKRLGGDAKGVRLVLDEGKKLLKDEGVKEIPSKGLPFNFRFHQAVDRVETTSQPEGTIVDVVQRGYQLGEEILRPALVKVAVPPKTATQATTETGTKS